jgi:outer membrane protein OmpA-like peptidoglycan-associated protein
MKSIIVLAAAATLLFSACASVNENPNTAKGAGIGAAGGAVLGGLIGSMQGNAGKGAAIGAVLGAGAGGVIGNRMDKQAKELEKIAETKRTEEGLVTKLKSDILFESGKADLKDTAKSNLTEMATIMKKYPENVLHIKGYTDSTGSQKTNEALSQKRADAVKSQLLANGIPASTVSAAGLGPASPVGDNKTDLGRKQNRRVEIEVTVDASKVPKK